MQKPDCIFCKIASGEMDSAKFWEDERFMAFLDINPNTKGMALVISKDHFDSYALDMPEEMYGDFFLAAKRVGKIMQNGLQVKRVALVMEGMGVNHAHIKLYPLYGLANEFAEVWAQEKVFFNKYEGFITTQLGPVADMTELKALARQIEESI